MAELRLEEEEMNHYFLKAQDLLGKEDIGAEDYAALAEQSAAEGRYLAAAYYYHLAESQCLPGEKADLYKDKTRVMIARAEENTIGSA
jgi:hypothetical protein